MAAGYRTVPHTADVRIEAWAPSREECVAQAASGMLTSFLDLSSAVPVATVSSHLNPDTDEDLLVGALDEVIYRLDTDGRIPVSVAVAVGGDVTLAMADPSTVALIGAVPKAVSLHELRFAPGPDGWACSVTVDV
jgi:protein archease